MVNIEHRQKINIFPLRFFPKNPTEKKTSFPPTYLFLSSTYTLVCGNMEKKHRGLFQVEIKYVSILKSQKFLAGLLGLQKNRFLFRIFNGSADPYFILLGFLKNRK